MHGRMQHSSPASATHSWLLLLLLLIATYRQHQAIHRLEQPVELLV
jgi:hypothetical protein